ncbi:nucleotide exchange factor GrpE [Streptomyces scopuliridis]|uniref:Nucleotide exchange factor GrpE n=1 Tax=Streptomyces scopuliridis TaxID=452529 RepID=A0ACD4ZUZ9_9ACTN|nr:nucleotide exchange factor GrpE [Streptomyces scopuliridis]WSB37830.1 nucleotide exchange factor GrpE [Streptomyces scopuliridis]WSC02285.1 nucleotide exchange factor GrpE [Streptomyces scopuliridis]WSC04178.1 nucleotide exchange factor GrpE [Streptomyces scopuliridis]
MATEPEEPEPVPPPDEADTAPLREEARTGDQAGQPDDIQKDLAEAQDAWRRALADLDNLRKRHARELEGVREAERARTAAEWLPVLDHLELALTHARADPTSIVQGVEAVRDQAVDVLARLGYPRQEESGVPFDPNRHEVVRVVDDPDTEPGTVVEVLRPGYGDDGRQLRPMAVAVSRRRE